MFDIAIIGAGPAGLTAGIYARRAGKTAVIFESTGIGGQIAQAGHVENYPAISSISGIDLSNAMYEQAEALGCEFVFDNVKSVERQEEAFKIVADYEMAEAKTVILATGARCRHLDIPGEEELIGKGVSYCAVCDGAFYKNKDVIVIGGGNSALEDALYLSNYCNKVTVVHRRDVFRADLAEVEKIKAKQNIETVMNARPTAINSKAENGHALFSSVTLSHSDGTTADLSADGVFIAVGRIPQNTAFAGLVELDSEGYIVADENCRTSAKGVFVAGDCRKKGIRQLTTAVADGTVAALAAIALIDA